MNRDILFKTDDFVFSYRVSGVLMLGGKVLLQKPKNDDYSIIGGHVSAFETAAEALRREYREELHADIEVGRLLAVGEVFFPWGSKPCHQIGLYYFVQLCGESVIPLDGAFQGYDDLGQRRDDLDFVWVSLDELRRGCKVYPVELIPYLLRDSGQTEHFISRS